DLVAAGPLVDPAGQRRAERGAHLVREEDPAGELADRVASEDVRGERRSRGHGRDVVEAEDRGPQMQRRRVPDVEQEQQRDAAEEAVESQQPYTDDAPPG